MKPLFQKTGTLFKHNNTDCDSLFIFLDIYEIENSTKTIYLMFYLINLIDFFVIMHFWKCLASINFKKVIDRQNRTQVQW